MINYPQIPTTGLVFCYIAFASHVKIAGESINQSNHSSSRARTRSPRTSKTQRLRSGSQTAWAKLGVMEKAPDMSRSGQEVLSR